MLRRSMDIQALLVDIIRQRPQRPLPKQQINLLQTDLLRLLKEEEDHRKRHDQIPRGEQEIKLPRQRRQRQRTNLRPKRRHEPIPNPRRESVTPGPDLHRHNLRHVDPRDGPEGEGVHDRDSEEEGDTRDAEAVLCAILVLAVDDGLADEGDGDADGAPEEGLAAPHAVEQEDADLVCNNCINAILYQGATLI